jgi:hypothetical protein
MNARAQEALAMIEACVASGRYLVLQHFTRRMDERGLFWPDILAVLDSASAVKDGGKDDLNRPRWLVTGKTTGGLRIEIVCVLDKGPSGQWTVCITAYWK